MLPIPIWRVVEPIFVVSFFSDLGIHVSANDKHVVFQDATH